MLLLKVGKRQDLSFNIYFAPKIKITSLKQINDLYSTFSYKTYLLLLYVGKIFPFFLLFAQLITLLFSPFNTKQATHFKHKKIVILAKYNVYLLFIISSKNYLKKR